MLATSKPAELKYHIPGLFSPNMIEHFRPGSLLVTSADRPDVIVAAALAAMNGVDIGAVLPTGGYDIPKEILDFVSLHLTLAYNL
ncbi:DRTGG domain-containing protein [Vibrio sp. PP-XX7]